MADEEDECESAVRNKPAKVCNFCEKPIRSGHRCFICNSNIIHSKCLDLVVKSSNLSDRKQWRCKVCYGEGFDSDIGDTTLIGDEQQDSKSLKTQIHLLNRLVKELENVNYLQKLRIQELENKYINRKEDVSVSRERAHKYSSVVKRTPVKKSSDVLIVKPINGNQEAKATVNELKQQVNPANMCVSVNNIFTKSNGTVVIKCDKAEDLKTLESNLKTKIGTSYSIVVPQKINPKVIIYNVSKDDVVDRDNLVENILKQNQIQKSDKSVFKLLKVLNKNSSVNLVLETDPYLFEKLMLKKHLYIGWKRCAVNESFHIIRCFKCSRYGHIAKDCKSPTSCPKCSGDHLLKDCNVIEFRCINCVLHNARYKTNLNVTHTVLDSACHCYIKMIQNAQRITNYTYNEV